MAHLDDGSCSMALRRSAASLFEDICLSLASAESFLVLGGILRGVQGVARALCWKVTTRGAKGTQVKFPSHFNVVFPNPCPATP